MLTLDSRTAGPHGPEYSQGSAVIFSLIETAIENGLDPFRYLTYILRQAPALASTGQDWASKLTAIAPTDYRVPTTLNKR